MADCAIGGGGGASPGPRLMVEPDPGLMVRLARAELGRGQERTVHAAEVCAAPGRSGRELEAAAERLGGLRLVAKVWRGGAAGEAAGQAGQALAQMVAR